MNYAVRYVSRGGNTKKVAEAIANTLQVTAKTTESPLAERVEVLFLGGAVYAAGIDSALSAFIGTLTPEMVGEVAVFSTAALKKSAYPEIKKQLEARGIRVSEREFHCRGQFAIAHRGHPNAEDLAEAATFAKSFLSKGERA